MEEQKAVEEIERREIEARREVEKQRTAEEEKKRQELVEREKQEKEKKEREEKTKQAETQVKSVDETNKLGITAASLDEYEKNQLMLARLRFETEQALSINTLKMYKFDLQKVRIGTVDFLLNIWFF